MTINSSNHVYSADVRLQLVVDGRILQLAQIGPDDFIVKHPEELPPCAAEVVMYVDGDESRWPVYLVEGMSKEKSLVNTIPRESPQSNAHIS